MHHSRLDAIDSERPIQTGVGGLVETIPVGHPPTVGVLWIDSQAACRTSKVLPFSGLDTPPPRSPFEFLDNSRTRNSNPRRVRFSTPIDTASGRHHNKKAVTCGQGPKPTLARVAGRCRLIDWQTTGKVTPSGTSVGAAKDSGALKNPNQIPAGIGDNFMR
ncbi:MAG: hypothetical protein EBY32_15730 [Proteobacteria bacterium]|nr:hypothetical protein [Pseudomonadota bacterium]